MGAERYIATYGQQTRELELESLGHGRYRVTLNGRAHEVDARRATGGNWSLLIDGQSYDIELEVAGSHEGEGRYNALVRGRVVPLTVQDERHIRMAHAARKLKVEGPQVITCPMPGKVVKVLVQPGTTVGDGQALVVIEAMKMENEIRAPTGGKVARIFVEEGQTIEANAKLVSLE
jgi:biotin carboxyl carrier protein